MRQILYYKVSFNTLQRQYNTVMGVNFYIKKANYEGKIYVDTQFNNVRGAFYLFGIIQYSLVQLGMLKILDCKR